MASRAGALAMLKSKAKEAQSDFFCPKCREDPEDLWWEIESNEMKTEGCDVGGGVMIFSGVLQSAGTLQEHFSVGVSQTKEGWEERLDSAIYQHFWSKGCPDAPAYKFSGQISRALTTGRLEIVYKQSGSKARVFGMRCPCCNQALVTEYHKNLPSETMAMVQLVHSAFLASDSKQRKMGDEEGGASSQDGIGPPGMQN